MEITTMRAQFSVLEKDESCGKVLGNIPTLFQIKCNTQEEHDKVMTMIEELL